MKARVVVLTFAAGAALLRTVSTGAQATNPPYLSQMPSVERVRAEIKGTDAMDTAARQMGAFWHLQEIIKTLSGLRWTRNQLTPDEGRLLGQYRLGYSTAEQPYAHIPKTSSHPDKTKWFNAHSFYEVDEGFRDELFERLLSPALREQFYRVKGETKAFVEQRKAARAQALKEEQQQLAQAQKEFDRQFKTPEWKRKLSRCLASGRSETQCLSDQLEEDLTDSRPAGLTMSGVYSGQGGFSVTFAPDGAAVACKGVSSIAKYAIQRDGNQLVIRLLQPSPADVLGFGSELMEKLVPKASSGNPDEWQGQRVAFPVRADGKLVALGTIRVTGPVPVGTREGTRTHYDSAGRVIRTEPITETVYEQKTEQCPLSTLTATGKSSPLVGGSVMGTFTAALGMVFDNPEPGSSAKVPEPGLRMNGRYVGPTGFEVEFRPESATIGCREAVGARDYSVTASAGRVLVNIQNGGTPLALELRPDGALAGAGQVQVSGRVMVSSNRRVDENTRLVTHDPVFRPVSDTCSVGVLTSAQAGASLASAVAGTGGAPSPTRQPAPATPGNAPSAANAVLTVTSGFAAQPGTVNPLAGKPLILFRESFAEFLKRKGTLQGPPGSPAMTAPLGVWASACQAGSPSCKQALYEMQPLSAGEVKTDAGGRGVLPAVPPGTYYLFSLAPSNGRLLVWDLRVDLKPGANSVALDQRNSAPLN